MARIKIKDIPKGVKISRDEMKRVFGGIMKEPEHPKLAEPFIFTPTASWGGTWPESSGAGTKQGEVIFHWSDGEPYIEC